MTIVAHHYPYFYLVNECYPAARIRIDLVHARYVQIHLNDL